MIAGMFLYHKSFLFSINLQKTLRLYTVYSIIILYPCIYLKAREQTGFNHRTPIFHERIYMPNDIVLQKYNENLKFSPCNTNKGGKGRTNKTPCLAPANFDKCTNQGGMR